MLRDRFPTLDGGDALADELLDLHTPRQLAALAAILERVEGDLRARVDRVGAAPGAAPRGRAGEPARDLGRPRGAAADRRRPRQAAAAAPPGASATRGSRSRTASAWCAASSSASRARAWGPVPGAPGRGPAQPRRGRRDRRPAPGHAGRRSGAIGIEMEHLAGTGIRPRVRLVLGTPPAAPGAGAPRLGVPRHGVGAGPRRRRDAAAGAAVRPGRPRRRGRWQAAAITRSLRGDRARAGPDARVDPAARGRGPGVARGHARWAASRPGTGWSRRAAARGRRATPAGAWSSSPPGSGAIAGRAADARQRRPARRPPDGAGDPDLGPRSDRLFAPAERGPSSARSRRTRPRAPWSTRPWTCSSCAASR